MKLEKLFLLGAIALGLAACSNEDTPVVQQAKNATMSLRIVQGGTRAIGDSELTTKESKIKRLDVFVFNGDARDGYERAENEDGVTEVKDIKVTTGSRTMMVVANATFTKEEMKAITSKADLLTKVATDLATQTLENGLLMTGEVTEAFTIAPGKNYYGYPDQPGVDAENQHSKNEPVKLIRVPARVSLISAVTAFEGSYAGFTFELEEVFLFNAKKQSKYFGDPGALVAGTELLSGVDLSSFGGPLKPGTWVPEWTAPYLLDVKASFPAGLGSITEATPVYYYVFENDASVQPTVLSIKGKIKKADNTYATNGEFPDAIDAQGFTYYSILVNATRDGYTYPGENTGITGDKIIRRNTHYKISVTIKRIGKKDPTDPPIEPATLDVKVEVVDWKIVNQEVVY